MDTQMRELARRAAAGATIEDVTRLLDAAGIGCLVLKGTALVLDVYPEDEPRPLTDVDVLVRPEHFTRAVDALEANGYVSSFEAPHAWSRTLTGRASPLPVDLHGMLFSRALFDMPAEKLFARAVCVRGLDVPVWRPHAHDLVGHAIGHFAKSRPPPSAETLGRDITFAMARDGLSHEEVARELVSMRLARAARYALTRVVDEPMRTDAQAILAALPRDVLATPLVAFARRTEGAPLRTMTSVASRHALNASLGRGLVSFAYQGLDLVERLTRDALSRFP